MSYLLLFTFLSLPVPQDHTHKVARHAGPTEHVSIDLATGTITRGPVAQERDVATVVDFSNIDLGGFVGVDSGAGACQWIDAATKGFRGNASDLMSDVVFAYCSSALDTTLGGPGGSLQLGFYEGYTVRGPAPSPSTGVGLFSLTGLPANSAHSSFFGGFRCYFTEVHLDDLVAFADGPIGYSWTFTDLGTDGVLAATFPYFSCVQSCSAAGPDAQGMISRIDQYCPPGTFRTSFTFGTDIGIEAYWTSIAMEIREAADLEATAVSWNATGVNQDVLQANAIVVGGSWTPTVTLVDAHGAGGPLSLSVRQSCVSGAIANSPVGGRDVQLLTQGPLGLKLAGSHDGSTGTFPSFPVPPSLDLICQPWAAQAVVVGGGFADLTTARCGTVGTIDVNPDP